MNGPVGSLPSLTELAVNSAPARDGYKGSELGSKTETISGDRTFW